VLPMLGTALGVGSEVATGMLPAAKFGETWWKWWLGDCVGVLVCAPLILVWIRPEIPPLRRWRLLEIATVTALFVFAATALAGGSGEFPLEFLIVPLLLWIGFRLRGPGVTTALLVLAVISVAGAAHGAMAGSLLHLQVFLATAALAGLGFVAVLDERDDHLADLQRANERLEGKVAERTRELERINRELTDAVSIVAHDVRGPVAGIRTLARHMRWAGLDLSVSEGNELLGEIERTSAEAVEMMGRLLDLQRASHRSVGYVKADVGGLVADMCRHYEIAAKEKAVALRVTRPARQMMHLVDADGLKFIVSNLVSNALKFLPEGGAVDVRLCESYSGCALVVEDNGPGIAERELAGIFKRFSRGANRPTAGESSTGLGLFIVRKLVLAMDGTLYVESAPGEGAAFVVEWPAAIQLADAGDAAPSA